MNAKRSAWKPKLLLGADHPENFPVASVLLPAEVRQKVLTIYQLARFADDLADEGPWPVGQRLACLGELADMLAGAATGPWLIRSGLEQEAERCITQWKAQSLDRERGINQEMLLMLSAFAWDTRGFWPQTAEQFDRYCRGSAASVGRMILALFRVGDPNSLEASDAICTALQRINMLQDCAGDASRGRIYIPASDLKAMGYDARQWFEYCAMGSLPNRLRDWIRAEAIAQSEQLRIHQHLHQKLPWRMSLELRAIIAGAAAIARALYESPDPVQRRPQMRSALRGAGVLRLLRDWLFGLHARAQAP